MAAMSTYTVRATRWAHGWELHIDGMGVTQSRNLDGAEQMVRDYIESLTGLDTGNGEITITPEVGDGLDEATQAARDAEGYKTPMATTPVGWATKSGAIRGAPGVRGPVADRPRFQGRMKSRGG
jgi:hypothetical protein